MKIRLAGILSESLVNGEGLRRVYFAQGCKHNCKGCFNPHTHDMNNGELVEVNNLIDKLKNNIILKGVTFSGGDPFEQSEQFAYMAKEVRKLNLDIWCYTGYTFEYILENKDKRRGWSELLNNINVLVDGKFEESLKNNTLKFKGSSNQRIIDVQKSLKAKRVILYNI